MTRSHLANRSGKTRGSCYLRISQAATGAIHLPVRVSLLPATTASFRSGWRKSSPISRSPYSRGQGPQVLDRLQAETTVNGAQSAGSYLAEGHLCFLYFPVFLKYSDCGVDNPCQIARVNATRTGNVRYRTVTKNHEDDTCRRSFDDVATGPGQYGGRTGPNYSEPIGLQALFWLRRNAGEIIARELGHLETK